MASNQQTMYNNNNNKQGSMPSGFHVATAPPAGGFTAAGRPTYYNYSQQQQQQPIPYNYGGSVQQNQQPANSYFSNTTLQHRSQLQNPHHQHQHQQYPHHQHHPHQHQQQQFNNPRKRPRQQEHHHQQQHPIKAFKCEPCRLEFESPSALEAHVATHIQCTACPFSASPKAVKAHYQGAHGQFSGSGFKTITIAVPGCPLQRFRICVGNREEDVQSWIAERRKRFPRLVVRNKQESQEKEQSTTIIKKDPPKKEGLSSLLDGYGSSSSDDNDDDDNDDKKGTEEKDETKKQETANESGVEDQPLRGEGTMAGSSSNGTKRVLCRFFARNGKCRNGEACSFRHEMSGLDNRSSAQDRGFNNNLNNKKSRGPDTLLRKLLENDIRRERILTLQLLEHIVDTDFLQHPNSATSAS